MKLKFVFLLVFFSIFLFCQKSENAIAVIQSYKKFNIYNSFLGSSVKYKISNNNSDEYYDLELLQRKGNRFFAKITNVISQNERKGWIDIKYVEIGLRNSNRNLIHIYPKPYSKYFKKVVGIHTESVIANVLDFKNNWLKVSFIWNGKKIIGWLSPENQCNNFFTMCAGE